MMTLKTIFLLTVLSTACMATNLILNPGFESGTTSWTASIFALDTSVVHSGTNAMRTGCVGTGCVSTLGAGAYVSQTLATLAGQNYDLSFWVSENDVAPSEVTVFWNGTMVADMLNPANNTSPSFVQISLTNLLATSSSTVFEVHGRQDPGRMYFDDFFADATPTPEPATLAIAGLGLAALGIFRRRSKSRRGR